MCDKPFFCKLQTKNIFVQNILTKKFLSKILLSKMIPCPLLPVQSSCDTMTKKEVCPMKCYIVDAFTKEIFKGNPAAVCVLDQWLPDELMQHIAIENSLSETAFTVKKAITGTCAGSRRAVKSTSAAMRPWGRLMSWPISSNPTPAATSSKPSAAN